MQHFINAIQSYSENLKDESDRNELTQEIKRICREEDIPFNEDSDLIDLIVNLLPSVTGGLGGTLLLKFSSLLGKLLKHKNKVNDIFVDHNIPLKSNATGLLSVTGLLLGSERGSEMLSKTIEDAGPYASTYGPNSDHSAAVEQLVTGVLKSKFPDIFNTIETLQLLKQ